MTDIVIVNWNSGDYLRNCVESVFLFNNEQLINRVYIIDNGSTDKSLDNIKENEKIVIIHNSENTGFSRACNQGFKLCAAPFVLLLNPDTRLLPVTLKDCVKFMEMHIHIDVLGCQLLNDVNAVTKSCARFPTPLRMCYDAVGLSKIAPQIFTPASLMTDWDHKESRIVDQVMGAYMFMRVGIFEKVGYFDERFFVYYEELDFSRRLALLGGKSFYSAEIQAIHSGGGTTRDVKGFRLFLNLRSRLLYSKKHFSLAGYLMVWAGTFFIEPVSRVIMLILSGRFKEINDVFRGYKLLAGFKVRL